jgi:hypothetical protein
MRHFCQAILSVTTSCVFRKPEKAWRDDGDGKLRVSINEVCKVGNIMKEAIKKEMYFPICLYMEREGFYKRLIHQEI